MKSKDVIKIAKIFDKFIELGSSLVLVEDCDVNIKAIKKRTAEQGVEIVTPYGTYYDDIDYESFKERIEDALEVMKEKDNFESPKKSKVVSSNDDAQVPPTKFPTIMEKVSTIPLSSNGAIGQLFADQWLTEKGLLSRMHLGIKFQLERLTDGSKEKIFLV